MKVGRNARIKEITLHFDINNIYSYGFVMCILDFFFFYKCHAFCMILRSFDSAELLLGLRMPSLTKTGKKV